MGVVVVKAGAAIMNDEGRELVAGVRVDIGKDVALIGLLVAEDTRARKDTRKGVG